MITKQTVTRKQFKTIWNMVRCNISCGYGYYAFNHPSFTVDKDFVREVTLMARGR